MFHFAYDNGGVYKVLTPRSAAHNLFQWVLDVSLRVLMCVKVKAMQEPAESTSSIAAAWSKSVCKLSTSSIDTPSKYCKRC
jgi:hypothetical protein